MRRIIVFLLMLEVMSSTCFAALSEDMNVYVRKDVFEVYMQNINVNMERIIQKLDNLDGKVNDLSKSAGELSERLDGTARTLSERIDRVNEALSDRIDGVNRSLSDRIDGVNRSLSDRIDGVNKALSGRIDGVNEALSGRIDGLDKRIDDLRNGIYLWLVAIGLIVAWPKARDMLKKLGNSAPSITLEDVQRLIEQNNAELRKSLQL